MRVSTAAVVAHVSLANGAVRFTDTSGKALLEETPARVLAGGVSQRFNPGSDEAFFGLGQHQNAQMNLNGEDVEIAQHNMDIGVPFVVSSRNYGVLWDNNSITRFGNPKPYGLASRDLKIRDAEWQGRRLHRALLDRRRAEARTRREGHQLPVHPRPLQLAEGTAGRQRSRCRARRLTSCRTRP